MQRFAQRTLSRLAVAIAALAALPASAVFHLWTLNELYSNADGTVQFIELTALAGGQQFLSGHNITSSSGGATRTYNFTTDLPGDTSNRRFLIGTLGFAALGIVAPDYTVPNGFLFPAGGTVSFAGRAAAFFSAAAIRSSRFSLAMTRSAVPSGVP